jgi:hypothetical protein
VKRLRADGRQQAAVGAEPARAEAGVGYPAPVARKPELDAAFLAIPTDDLVVLEYVSVRKAAKPPAEPTTYHGYTLELDARVPAAAGASCGASCLAAKSRPPAGPIMPASASGDRDRRG